MTNNNFLFIGNHDPRSKFMDIRIILSWLGEYMAEGEDEDVVKRSKELEEFTNKWIEIWESEVLRWYTAEEIAEQVTLLKSFNWEELEKLEGWHR